MRSRPMDCGHCAGQRSELKAQHRISVTDSWIIATAISRNATLVHKDPEFDALSDRVTMKALPCRRTK